MSGTHYALRNKPGYLDETDKLCNAICFVLVTYSLHRKTPARSAFPFNKILLEQPGVLVRPNHPVALGRAVSESEHADIEGVDELELTACECRAVFYHSLALRPFL
jgi:hypothetical protein